MCGIVGVVSANPLTDSELSTVSAMNALQAHRGPDGTGSLVTSHVVLAMSRLAIHDLASGQQPLYNEDRSIALVVNGEIYNFVELRRELEGRGHRFATGSDCETILHLYEESGEDFVQRLRGMFAGAIFDGPRRKVILFRDRLGEKPLHLFARGRQLWFSSELRPMTRSGLVPIRPDPLAVVDFLYWGFIPEPLAPIEGVEKLPAGCLETFSLETGARTRRAYWSLDEIPPIDADPVSTVRSELERVIRLSIRSDVPVGVCLSGGIDSSSIAALAAREYPGTMHAVSVGYEHAGRHDESQVAERFAAHLGIPFHRVKISAEEVVEAVPDMVQARDEPITDLAGFPLFFMFRRCRELGLPVMLSGLGGDELFRGYRLQAEARTLSELALQPGLLATLGHLRPHAPPPSPTMTILWLRDLAGMRSGFRALTRRWRADARMMRFWDLTHGFRETERHMESAAARRLAEAAGHDAALRHHRLPPSPEPLEVELTKLIIRTYLLGNGLAQTDRLSMRHGIEARTPLVDYRLVETAVGLRKARPDSDLGPKIWLRKAVADLLPDWIANRPKKGFSSPWRTWVPLIGQRYAGLLPDGLAVSHGLLDGNVARACEKSLRSKLRLWPDHVAQSYLKLELWLRGLS
jgi:asparagine synthase (glutamine-hydrolysing)